MGDDAVDRRASFSRCGRFRYTLRRTWGPGERLVFVGLNPSTADAHRDDPTIRRCTGFARREGYGGLVVVNVFAFRATKPTSLFAADDPVGRRNNGVLRRETAGCDVVCCWGNHGRRRGRGAEVLDLLRGTARSLSHFGLTKKEEPRHPLYVRASAALVEFELA